MSDFLDTVIKGIPKKEEPAQKEQVPPGNPEAEEKPKLFGYSDDFKKYAGIK